MVYTTLITVYCGNGDETDLQLLCRSAGLAIRRRHYAGQGWPGMGGGLQINAVVAAQESIKGYQRTGMVMDGSYILQVGQENSGKDIQDIPKPSAKTSAKTSEASIISLSGEPTPDISSSNSFFSWLFGRRTAPILKIWANSKGPRT